MEPAKRKLNSQIDWTQPNPNWVLQCLTAEDWEAFTLKFANAASERERKFHSYLVNDLVPHILHDLAVFYI